MMWLPTIEQVERLHEKMICASGGKNGTRERGLVESALARADASFAGFELYPDVVRKAAAIGCGLTQNHGFLDGNKRIGMATMLLILRRNCVTLSYTQQELIDLGLGTAMGEMSPDKLVDWLVAHGALLPKDNEE